MNSSREEAKNDPHACSQRWLLGCGDLNRGPLAPQAACVSPQIIGGIQNKRLNSTTFAGLLRNSPAFRGDCYSDREFCVTFSGEERPQARPRIGSLPLSLPSGHRMNLCPRTGKCRFKVPTAITPSIKSLLRHRCFLGPVIPNGEPERPPRFLSHPSGHQERICGAAGWAVSLNSRMVLRVVAWTLFHCVGGANI